MALLFLGEDPWLLEHESCEKLHRDIMEQLTERQQYPRTSDKYSQLSATVRLWLKQFNNEIEQLQKKLEISGNSGAITQAESERRVRQIEVLRSRAIQMQRIFNDQVVSKLSEDRRQLIGEGNSQWTNDNFSRQGHSTDEVLQEQKRMLKEQDEGLENLSQIISRQKGIASTISNEVDYHNEILDDLGTQIDNTDQRVRNKTLHVGTIDRKDNTCAYWVVIVLLFISIIAVVAI